MPLSMTGYGRGLGEADGVVLQLELRSVNHRYLDVRVHLPPSLLALEPRLLTQLQARLARGRVDVTVRPDHRSRSLIAVRADLDLARQYQAAIKELADTLHVSGSVDALHLAGLKDVLVSEEAGDVEAAAEALDAALATALDQLLEMRRAEGERLARDLHARVQELSRHAEAVRARLPAAVDEGRSRLEARVRDLLQRSGGEGLELDEGRLLTEVALEAERSDATEELVRLVSHLDATCELLDAEGPVGRQADFLCQELLRELNTMGAKVSDLEITRLVLEMKAELERVREQVQNLE